MPRLVNCPASPNFSRSLASLKVGRFRMIESPRIEKLRTDHAVAGFDCGREELIAISPGLPWRI